ncbi:MAG: hypothetical protein IJ094_13055 [Bacilli bacterium]|nr:hypothetical protein [Bacilli bacterium]
MTNDKLLEVIKKAIKEENKRLTRIIKNLLDEHHIPDDKKVFIVEEALTEFKWDQHKAERKYYYYICESEEEVQMLIKSIENVGVDVGVISNISKNKIKKIEEEDIKGGNIERGLRMAKG